MLVNHKIQIFLIILFVGINVLISIGMERPLATHVTPFWPDRHTNTASPPHYFPQPRTGRESRPHPSFTELTTSSTAYIR